MYFIESIVDNHDLQGWQIYDENGSVAVKICFKTDDNNGNISKPINTGSWQNRLRFTLFSAAELVHFTTWLVTFTTHVV